jgi:rod shape-determining protein MreC
MHGPTVMVQVFKNIAYATIVGLLIYVGVSQSRFIAPRQLELFSSVILYPFLVVERKLIGPINIWWHNYKVYRELKDTLERYKQNNEELQAQIIELQAIGSYKQATKELTDFAKRYSTSNTILAQVLLRNLDEHAHFFLINAGVIQNVTHDMIVVYKNCLVGRISEVYTYHSKVVLITDVSCKIAAYCAANRVQGIHEGTNTVTATRLAFVNHLETIQDRDLILSSGEGLVFPQGFALGRIKTYKPDGLYYSITLEPLLDFTTLDYCFIMQKGAQLRPHDQKDPDCSGTSQKVADPILSTIGNTVHEEQHNEPQDRNPGQQLSHE